MKRSLLLLMLLCFAVFGVVRAQETLTVHDGTATNGYVPVYGFYADAYLKCEMVYPAAELGDMEAGTITGMTFYASTPADDSWGSANFQVFLTEVADATISAYVGPGTVVYEGALDGTQSEVTITFTTPYVYNGGNLLVGVYNTVKGSYKSITWAGEEVTGASITGYSYNSLDEVSAGQRNFLPKTTFEYTPGEVVGCGKPKQLAVNYTGGTTATVTWTGDATLYNIDVNGTVTNNVTSPYTLTDLEFGTTYAVKVQANCDGDLSDFTSAVNFTTDLCAPENQCEITYELADSYGDGWNGNTLSVVDVATEVVLATWTIPSGNSSASGSLALCDGREIQFVWAGTSWPYENSFTVYDINGEIICQHIKDDVGPAVGILSNYTVSCTVSSCRKPTNLTATEVSNRTATLSWTENGEARAWNLLVNGDLIENVDNPYTLTGLTPSTTYTVQVSPVCEDEKWSDAISFTTEVACPAPTKLDVDATPISATINWEGDASDYTLRYGTCAADPTEPATIVFHADDVWQDGSGYQMLLDADATAFGTIIPETGALSTNCSGNEDIYAEFEYKIPANADGECTTSNVVIDNTITLQIPAGTYDWCITNPTPGDRIWIASAQGNVGGRADDYVFEAGKIYEFHMYLLGSNDATDVTITCSNIEWTYVNNATSPYTINGLDPETEYYVGVQAVCGGEDGESAWTNTTFTTPSNCEAPSNLAVTNLMPTTATLNWTGYQDGFEVWYRPVAEGSELINEDFEEGLTWTTIDADGDGYDWVRHVNTGTGNYNTHSGDASMNSGSYDATAGALNPDNYLVSPQVALGGSITFWASAQDASYPSEHFGVAVSTTSNTDASAFTTIKEWTMTAKKSAGDCKSIYSNGSYIMKSRGNRDSGAWYEYTVDLSAYAGQTGYVAIRHFDCSDMFYLVVDDITIKGAAQEEQEWIQLTTDATTLDIENLEPETEYEWQVRGENRTCGEDGVTAWSEMGTFTTPNACDLPIDLVAEVEATSATLSWTGYQESFNVTYYTPATGNILIETGVGFNGSADWTAVTEDEETGFYYLSSDYSYVGYGFSSTSTPQYLISPEFDALEGNSFVEFMYYATGTEEDELFPETFKIGYSTTDAEVASFTWGELYTVSDIDYMDVDLPAGAKYFAIQYESDHAADSTMLFFLDFTVVSNYLPAGTPTTLTNVTSPVTITGLTPETLYRWNLTGVSDECGELEAVYDYFTTLAQTNVTQTTELAKGWNWFSTYIVGRPTDLLQMLETSLGENGTVIKSKAISTDYYEDYGWYGELDDEGLMSDQMYMIETSAACTVELEGMPINTAEVEITINHGWNWIGFPSAEPMNVVDAFAGFEATDGDILKNKAISTDYYEDFGWYGELETMEPGQGFMYYSNSQESKTLVLGSKSKAIRSNVGNVLNLKKHLLKKLEIQKAKPIKK